MAKAAVVLLSIRLIRLDGGTQSRAELDPLVIDDYSDAMEGGAEFPPVVVFYDGTDYWLADGFHRVHGAIGAERTEVEADVRQGSLRDAILYSVGANAKHGLKRSNADKRRAVETLLGDEEWTARTDNWIAEKCGVSQPFVSSIRKQLITVINCDDSEPATRTGRDGKSYKAPAVEAQPDDEVDEELESSDGEFEGDDYELPEAEEPQQPRTWDASEASTEDCEATSDLQSLIDRDLKFACIYADPPWDYGNQGTRAATSNHYKSMTIEQLCELPVASLVADRAHLHLWTTAGHLPRAFEVMRAWGFEYKSYFCWCKPQLGLGNYYRVSSEILLLGIRGGMVVEPSRRVKNWAEVPRGKHSAKPDEFRMMVESMTPGPRLELFGRLAVRGWTIFGNQVERTLLAGA